MIGCAPSAGSCGRNAMGDNWTIRDAEAYETAAQDLIEQGYLRLPCRWYQYRFTKGREVVVLTRTLGKLDWHPKVLER